MKTERIGITWPLSDRYGWGVFGLNLALQLLERGGPLPLLLSAPSFGRFPPGVEERLAPFIKEQKVLLDTVREADKHAKLSQALVIHALANGFRWDTVSDMITGRRNVGFIFFEDARFDLDALKRAQRFDRILAGSTWNSEVLKAHGLDNVARVLQGIDETLFHPRERTAMFGDRFVVFSGGKLELRKGQDTVLAAFKVFRETHADALLVTAWHNPWPGTAMDIAQSPHVEGAPDVDDQGALRIVDWAAANGVRAEDFVDVGLIPHEDLVQVMAEADVAVFPNRCEGGTNLVAMETMATGIPCILSANTGHLDLIAEDPCYPLRRQIPVASDSGLTEHWRDSQVDEVVAALEEVHGNRDEAARRARAGAEFMKGMTWKHQIGELMETISDLL